MWNILNLCIYIYIYIYVCVCVCVCMCVYDSHVFEPLKDAISGANFSNDEEVLL